jgi:hypothetical protein
MVFQGGFFNVQLAAQYMESCFVGQRNTPPICRDGCIDVSQVMAIENNFLHVNFGPSHAQTMEKTEITSLHGDVFLRSI